MNPLTLLLSLVAVFLTLTTFLAADSSLPSMLERTKAKTAFERGNYAEAERIYQRLLSEAPKDLYLLSNLGVIQFRLGKLKEASEILQQAIAVAPDDEFAHTTLGIVLYSQGRYDDAIKSLQRALELDPKSQTARNYLDATIWHRDQQEKARQP